MLIHWLWLAQRENVSAQEKQLLLQYFQSPEDIFYARRSDYRRLESLSAEAVESLLDKDLGQARHVQRTCAELSLGVITYSDSSYPAGLRNIEDPPLVLYCKGVMPDLEMAPGIGVVGTRKSTPNGLNAARKLGGQIAACGGIVVSGGALGIDAAALQGALDADKPCVAVLAGGLDKPYPKTNLPLFEQMLQKGCMISEYAPGTPHHKWNFLRRNRLISAMCDGVLVVEAPEVSGALNTARWAYKQGKDVFVLPGNPDSPSCTGSNTLLREGARPVSDGWSLLEYYRDLYPYTLKQAQTPVPAAPISQPEKKTRAVPDKKVIDNPEKSTYSVLESAQAALTEQEKQILGLLSREPEAVDALLQRTDIPSPQVLMILTKLSMKGIVENLPGRRVALK